MKSQKFAWVQETGSRRGAKGPRVPEGIFYPLRPNLTHAEWEDEAYAAGEALWQAIGSRPTVLVQKYGGVWHALRSKPRGYGKRRRLWEQTTECGMLFNLRIPRAERPTSPLAATTCLACRKTVRERAERDIEYGDFDTDQVEDALVEYERFYADDWWRIQADWHKPDPIVLWDVPADLNYSLIGG